MTEKLTIEEKFEVGLNELISLCLDGGMHPSEMVKYLQQQIQWAKDPTSPVKGQPELRRS